jgi:hypothetical protein
MSGQRGTFIILEIGAEGGSLKVLGRLDDNCMPYYSIQLRDQSLEFLSEEESGSTIRRDSEWTASWDDAIKNLGRYPWPMLYPLYVHPDYRERVLANVEQYRGRDGQPARASAVEKWTRVCQQDTAM